MSFYRCNYCGQTVDSKYDIDIQTEFEGPGGHSDWREWPYRLCPVCYSGWYEGVISTRKMVETCNKSIRGGATYIRQSAPDIE